MLFYFAYLFSEKFPDNLTNSAKREIRSCSLHILYFYVHESYLTLWIGMQSSQNQRNSRRWVYFLSFFNSQLKSFKYYSQLKHSSELKLQYWKVSSECYIAQQVWGFSDFIFTKTPYLLPWVHCEHIKFTCSEKKKNSCKPVEKNQKETKINVIFILIVAGYLRMVFSFSLIFF